MPAKEIRLVVNFLVEPTPDDIRRVGRDAAFAILDRNGSARMYAPFLDVDSVRFNEFNWESRRYMERDDRDWQVTQQEQDSWDQLNGMEEDDDEW